MDSALAEAPRARLIDLAGRGGAMAGLEFGDSNRPIDIVFVHANGFNARTYRTILAPLAEQFRILAVDQRGHGRSTLPADTEGRTSWDGLRDDLLALLETLDLRDVVLSGHSMGGTACVLAQALAPERVRSVVLFDPVVTPGAGQIDPEQFANSPLVQGALRRRSVFPDKASVVAAYTGRGAFKTWQGEMLADYVADGFRERADGEVELSCSPAWEASNFSDPHPEGAGRLHLPRRPAHGRPGRRRPHPGGDDRRHDSFPADGAPGPGAGGTAAGGGLEPRAREPARAA